MITAGDSIVRGLAINGFHVGIYLDTLGGNVIEGNFIGTDIQGTTAVGNSSGVYIDRSSNNTIGGTSPAARNIISASSVYGVSMVAAAATGNLIQGNLIGTDISGTLDLGNLNAIRIQDGATGNTVGGVLPGAGNVVSGNHIGIELAGAATNANLV